jgi:uncharacterized membrane protein
MKPFDLIADLERVRAVDPAARAVGALARTVGRAPRLRSVLAGEPVGHAAHPMLVQLPIGAWVSAGWLDCLPGTEHSAAVLTGVGIVSAVPAIAAGLVDFDDLSPHGRRTAVFHAAANSVSLALQIVSLHSRLTGRLRRGQWIGFVGTISLAVGGLIGGQLAHPRSRSVTPV